MKYLIIILVSFLPFTVSAQILRAYGVIDIGASFPIGTATGAKFAYKAIDSSYYRWVSGNTWVKILESSIDPDTLYLKQLSGTTALVDGDTIDISTYLLKSDTTSAFASYLKRPVGWGLSLLTGKYPFVDSSKVASRYYVSTSPTTIANNYIATSNGSNLVARNLFDNNTYVGILNSKPFQLGQWTTAGRPTGVNGYMGYNTTNNTPEFYSSSRWVAPAQADNADGKFLFGTIPYADANGRLKYGSYSELYFSSTDLVCYRAPYFSSNAVGIAGGIRVYNTNTTSGLGYGSITLYPSTGGKYAQFFCTNTLYPGYGVITAQSFGHYTNGSGGMGIQLDNASSSLRVGIGSTGTIEKMRMDANGLGLFTTATQELDVNGDVRVRDSLRLPILSSILQTEASGWVKALTIGSGLSYSAGTLSSTGTWLKAELEAGRDVDVTGIASTDFRVRNTRIQFDDKFKIGSDSSLSFNPSTAVLKILKPSIQANFELHGNMELNTAPATGSVYIGAYGVTGFAAEADSTTYLYSTNKRFAILHGYGFSVNNDVLMQATKSAKITFRGFNDTIPGIGISLSKSTFIRERLIIAPDSTFKFDPTIDVPQFNKMGLGNKEAADLSKTESSYAAWLMTDGTVGEKSLSTIRDGNGIYTGSGTLANHTTRALIPSTGNLLFSQVYNTSDSAYIQIINNLDGNREVRGGLTDTASTGFSKFRFYQDEPNEEMGWEILTDDGTGTTAVGAQGGNLSLYADAAGTVEVRGQELRLNNGEVSMNQYGQGNMKASDLSATDSKFVAKFGDAGKVLDYYLARDTFIEDVTLFSVGTLMNDCQELTIVSSMTATAPSHQEIRFPDAGDYLRGKKIIVYQKKKEAGIYVPKIKVVGGVSRLYFTTNTATTDPSDQSVLTIDDVTWFSHGTTFEFTCLRIDNTPSYRWVLKQR